MIFEKLLNMFTWLYMEADAGATAGTGDNTQGTQAQVPPPDPTKGGSGEPAWTKERAERERRSGVKDFFKRPEILAHLGITDAKEVETADDKKLEEVIGKLLGNLGEHKQLKDAQLTEAERTTKQVDTLTKEVARLTVELEAASNRTKEVEQVRVKDRVENALRIAVSNAKAKKVDDVLVLLNTKHADKVAKLVNDKGEVDAKLVDALVDDFRKDRPEDFGVAGAGSPSNRGGKTPDPGKDAAIRASLHNRRTILG